MCMLVGLSAIALGCCGGLSGAIKSFLKWQVIMILVSYMIRLFVQKTND